MELQEDLIGQEKERAGDESRRAKVHQQWLEQQDAQQVAHLMAGLRNGFRRKRAGDLLDEDVSSWFPQALTIFTRVTAVGYYCRHAHSKVPGVPKQMQWLFVVHATCHTGMCKTTNIKGHAHLALLVHVCCCSSASWTNSVGMHQVGTDHDTRKRRACRDDDEESLASDNEEDRLAGLLRGNGDDSDDAGLDEHEKEQLRRAHVLKGIHVSFLMNSE